MQKKQTQSPRHFQQKKQKPMRGALVLGEFIHSMPIKEQKTPD